MNNEQDLPETPPQEGVIHEQPLPPAPEAPEGQKTPAGWAEFEAAKLGPDGKKRDPGGNEVPYPFHLTE